MREAAEERFKFYWHFIKSKGNEKFGLTENID